MVFQLEPGYRNTLFFPFFYAIRTYKVYWKQIMHDLSWSVTSAFWPFREMMGNNRAKNGSDQAFGTVWLWGGSFLCSPLHIILHLSRVRVWNPGLTLWQVRMIDQCCIVFHQPGMTWDWDNAFGSKLLAFHLLWWTNCTLFFYTESWHELAWRYGLKAKSKFAFH